MTVIVLWFLLFFNVVELSVGCVAAN
uniref:Uncharacterized protein n=1 Tax=Anguilla anguilla TaxID=7936 RepID=A0A0E9UGB3_ANGAN